MLPGCWVIAGIGLAAVLGGAAIMGHANQDGGSDRRRPALQSEQMPQPRQRCVVFQQAGGSQTQVCGEDNIARVKKAIGK